MENQGEVELADAFDIYAYDGNTPECARKYRTPELPSGF
jgi:hypothetical protein